MNKPDIILNVSRNVLETVKNSRKYCSVEQYLKEHDKLYINGQSINIVKDIMK